MELAPPYVDTGLDAKHRESVVEIQGGEEKAMKPMGVFGYGDGGVEGWESGGYDGVFGDGGGGLEGGFWAGDGGVGD